MTQLPSTRRNTVWLTAGTLLGRALAFLVFRHFTRLAAPEAVGVWGVAVELSSILVVAASFGLDNLLTREALRRPTACRALFFTSLRLRLLAGVVAFGGLLVFLALSGYDDLTRRAVLTMALGLFFEVCAMSGDSLFQARDRIPYQAATQVIASVLYFLLAWYWIDTGYGVMGIVAAHLLSRVLRLVLVGIGVAPLIPRNGQGGPGLQELARLAWPLFLAGILGILAFKIDTLVVMGVAGKASAGIYTAARRVLDLMALTPFLFTVAVYPALQRAHQRDPDSLAPLQEAAPRALAWVLTAAVPLAAGGILAARPILAFLVTDRGFEQAPPVLRLLMLCLPLLAANQVSNRLVLALGKERRLILISAAGLLATLVLNAILVPQWGARGAALALVGTLLTVQIIYISILRGVGLRLGWFRALGAPLLRTLLAWSGAWILVRLFRPAWPVTWLGFAEPHRPAFLAMGVLTALLYAGLTWVMMRTLRATSE